MSELKKSFYKEKDSQYYGMIKLFMISNWDREQREKFFQSLYDMECNELYPKRFSINMEDMGTTWGNFDFHNFFGSESQRIMLNDLNNYPNNLYKNALQLLNYDHETSHACQRDQFLYREENRIPEDNGYDVLLNLELFCKEHNVLCKYEQRLVEIDAIYQSIMRYQDAGQHQCFPKTIETLSVVLYACVRYFASLNLDNHHEYCPDSYKVLSSTLIDYYKKHYDQIRKYLYCQDFTINDLIEDSENLKRLKKDEMKNINYDEVEKGIDGRTQKVLTTMRSVYQDMLKLYTPSELVCNFAQIKKEDWVDFVKNNNMVKVSALMTEDVHVQMGSGNSKLFLKPITNIEWEIEDADECDYQ